MRIDLHCHLDGSLSLSYMRSVLGNQVTRGEIQVSDDCTSLTEYLQKFELPLQCLQTEEQLKAGAYDFMKNVSEDDVKYVEVRFAPMLSVHDRLSTDKVIESVLAGMEKGKQDFDIDYNVIVCAMRHHSYEMNLQMLKSARQFLGKGVCAADLAGDESSFPMEGFMELFRQVKAMDFPFTVHAGECGSRKNIYDSIDAGAARIGHGIAMRGDLGLEKICRERKIGIEMCPISNLQTKAATRENYPLREFLDAGVYVTVNTDNRTVSGSTIAKEFDFIKENYHVKDEELKRITRNAILVSFADDEIKQKLLRLQESVSC